MIQESFHTSINILGSFVFELDSKLNRVVWKVLDGYVLFVYFDFLFLYGKTALHQINCAPHVAIYME